MFLYLLLSRFLHTGWILVCQHPLQNVRPRISQKILYEPWNISINSFLHICLSPAQEDQGITASIKCLLHNSLSTRKHSACSVPSHLYLLLSNTSTRASPLSFEVVLWIPINHFVVLLHLIPGWMVCDPFLMFLCHVIRNIIDNLRIYETKSIRKALRIWTKLFTTFGVTRRITCPPWLF